MLVVGFKVEQNVYEMLENKVWTFTYAALSDFGQVCTTVGFIHLADF